jgi:hypothetical protein
MTDEITHEDLELMNSNPDVPDLPEDITGKDIYLEFLDEHHKSRIITFPEVLLEAEKENVISNQYAKESLVVAKIGTKDCPLPIREVTSEKFIEFINFMAYPYIDSEQTAKDMYAVVLKLKMNRYTNHLKKELIDINNFNCLEGKEAVCSEYIECFKKKTITLQETFGTAFLNHHLRVANWCIKQDKNLEMNILMDEKNIQYLMYHSCKYGLRSLLEYIFDGEIIKKPSNKKQMLKLKTWYKKLYLVVARNDHLHIMDLLKSNPRTEHLFNKLKLELLDVCYHYNSLKILTHLLHEKDLVSKQQIEKMLEHAKENKLDHYIKLLEEKLKSFPEIPDKIQ